MTFPPSRAQIFRITGKSETRRGKRKNERVGLFLFYFVCVFAPVVRLVAHRIRNRRHAEVGREHDRLFPLFYFPGAFVGRGGCVVYEITNETQPPHQTSVT